MGGGYYGEQYRERGGGAGMIKFRSVTKYLTSRRRQPAAVS